MLIGRKAVAAVKVGKGHALKHRVLDMAAGAIQPKYPVTAMSTYLNGFHMYADDMGRQVEASHFCIHLRHDLHQCVIFDRNAADARLIGIEYIISEERFRSLPEDEKRLWHSHRYEVKSGILIAPRIPRFAEHAYLEDLVSTYGKTFHTWQYDRDDFPYGIPQLMMGFTEDGQADQALIAERDRRLGVSASRKREQRQDIPAPAIVPGANHWECGRTVQTRIEEVDVQRVPGGPHENPAGLGARRSLMTPTWDDVAAVIAAQHEHIKLLLVAVQKRTGQERAAAFYTLRLTLALHETAEQQVIHPQAMRELDLRERPATDRLAEEETAAQTISALELLDVDSDQFKAHFPRLAADVIDHAAAEETDEWPALRHVTDPRILDVMLAQLKAIPELAESSLAPGSTASFSDMQEWAKSMLPAPPSGN